MADIEFLERLKNCGTVRNSFCSVYLDLCRTRSQKYETTTSIVRFSSCLWALLFRCGEQFFLLIDHSHFRRRQKLPRRFWRK